MRAGLALAALAALAACSDPVRDAETQLKLVEHEGDKDATCAAARKVAAAYLQQHEHDGYHRAKVAADIDCQAADLARGR